MTTILTPLKQAPAVLFVTSLLATMGCAHTSIEVLKSSTARAPFGRIYTVVHAGMVQQAHAQMLAIAMTNELQAVGVASDFHVFGNLDLNDGNIDAKIEKLGAQAVVALEPIHAVEQYGYFAELTYRVTLTNLQDKRTVWVANVDGTGDYDKRMKLIAHNLVETLTQSGFVRRQVKQ